MKKKEGGQGKVNRVKDVVNLEEDEGNVIEIGTTSGNGMVGSGSEAEDELVLDAVEDADPKPIVEDTIPLVMGFTDEQGIANTDIWTYEEEDERKDGRSKVRIVDDEPEEVIEEFSSLDEVIEQLEYERTSDDNENKKGIDPFALTKHMMEQAWKDGHVTEDEMGLLEVLADKIGLSTDEFDRLMKECEPFRSEKRTQKKSVVTLDEDDYGPDVIMSPVSEGLLSKNLSIERTTPLPDGSIRSNQPPEAAPGPDNSTVGRQTDIITLRTSVRGGVPLSKSFDLTQKENSEMSVRRCPSCTAQINHTPIKGVMKCPVCGVKIDTENNESEGLRKVLDLGKEAYKNGNFSLAKDLYSTALVTSSDNKEAMFYLQKLSMGSKSHPKFDISHITMLPLENQGLDTLLNGGIVVGSQVLVKGPPFCGKEILIESLIASSLKKGLPLIYVSSNRAMKEVIKGISERLPDFKEYNKKGMVRMFDLFSQHSDNIVLKEGHRIFNIQEKRDFLSFQNDLIMVQERLMGTYGGGVLIISSLSPIISQVDVNDLMKFLQVLISRSKNYGFTNVYDIAANVHTESMMNSLEYLMDGIAEFREKEGKNSLRLKGFKQGVVSRDWIEYNSNGKTLTLSSSFHEQRII